ncbi:unnamed protein product, partial [Sphagnum troendelagicum]
MVASSSLVATPTNSILLHNRFPQNSESKPILRLTSLKEQLNPPSCLPLPPSAMANPSPSLSLSVLGVKKISAIAVGEKLPEAELSYLDKEENVQTVKISELARGKKLVLFAVPGAFTPTCSQKHLPGFVEKSGELRDAGVDTIACVSVNDAFVMKAWGENVGVGDKVLLLSDGLGKFTKALGATLDLSDKAVGLGIRSRRYALLAEDGVVTSLNMEEGGAFTISGPDEILKALK